jgi:endonuclease/exonuclease/phosphatase family metal-dependent hydrolase
MEAFVDQFLDGEYVVFQSNENWQTVGALVHQSIAADVTAWTPTLPALPAAWRNIPYYPWGLIGLNDRKKHNLSRQPLLLSYSPQSGVELRVIVVHTKSKYSKLKQKSQWEQREPEAVLDALNARAKLSAEVFRIRDFLNQQLAAPEEPRSIVIMGDMNDGPYAELMEQEFLIHNIVDELAGSLVHPESYFQHAMTPETLAKATTTRFPDPLQDNKIVEELIDHMLVSPAIWSGDGDFHVKHDSCQVETSIFEQFYDAEKGDKFRDHRPSDHKPVSVVFEH